MFCPECDTIMEEINSVPGPNPADDLVIDLFECPRCHCTDERQRARPQFAAATNFADDSLRV
jgi:hypothetical protein